jgi:hypothetical protein
MLDNSFLFNKRFGEHNPQGGDKSNHQPAKNLSKETILFEWM